MIGPVLDATLLVLAGGQGRRMGRPKALLPVAGTTLVGWQVERLGSGFAEVLVSANEEALVPAGMRMVADRSAGSLGPLAGIEAGLEYAAHEALVVVACDMPRVTVALAGRLLGLSEGHDAAVPLIGRRPEPACACYRRSALGTIRKALDDGSLKAAAVLSSLDVAWLEDPDPALFWNLNTPEDYQVFLSEL
jgi:molybdopterin-guanine dinucleotide biosynthesis protein A